MLNGFEHLSPKQRFRFQAAMASGDPSNEIVAEHAVTHALRERVRLLLGEHEPHRIRARLHHF